MRPREALREWSGRILRQGPSRIALGLGVVFLLLAIAMPQWSYSFDRGGGDRDTFEFGWTTYTQVEFQDDRWVGTAMRSYEHPSFDAHFVAATVGATYVVALVFLLTVVAAAMILAWPRMRTMGPLAYLVLCLLVVVIGFSALLYPVLALPSGLASDMAPFPVGGGYWGSALYAGPPSGTFTWGAGLGWWFILLAVACATIGAALPYLKSVRAMGPPKPQAWRPGR